MRVVCDGCDWTADCKSGAFSSVGLAVKSLACLRGHIPCRLSARFADGDVSAAACRASMVCDGFDSIAERKKRPFSSVGAGCEVSCVLSGHTPCGVSARFADGDVSDAALLYT